MSRQQGSTSKKVIEYFAVGQHKETYRVGCNEGLLDIKEKSQTNWHSFLDDTYLQERLEEEDDLTSMMEKG